MKRNTRKRINLPTDVSSSSVPPQSTKTTNRRAKKQKTDTNEDDSVVSPYFQNTGTPVPTNSDQHQSLGKRLDRDFYNQETINLSRALLGKVLCRKLPGTETILRGTIVETEAYPGVGDAASHSFKGVPTQSSMAMFMDPGTAYVYMTYGMYHCFNISSNDTGGASLLRAVEVHEDLEIMHNLRQSKKKQSDEKNVKRLKPHELANGPSKLCLSFNINRDLCNKTDMTCSDDLWIEESIDPKYQLKQFVVLESRRVGIESTPPEARNKQYRFFIDENPCVSKAKFKDTPPASNKKVGKGASTATRSKSRR